MASAAAVALITATVAPAVAAPADPFAECRRAFAERPGDYESSYCFYQATLAGRLWDSAPAVLDELIAAQPANYWLPLTLGHVYRGRDAARAEAAYRRAAEGFRQAGHAEGEVLARISLRDMLFPLGRADDAAREVDRVVAVAAHSDDAMLKARVWTAQATQLQDAGGDLGLAYGLLKRAESVVFPAGPYRLKRTLLSTLGSAAFRLGRFDEALSIFEALDVLAATAGEARLRANAQYNILNTMAMKETARPTMGARTRMTALAERALATAVAAQSDDLAAKSHLALAELLAADPGTRTPAVDHARRCGALAAQLRRPYDETVCAWLEASLTADPSRRAAAERRALDATARAHSPRTDAFSAGWRMRLSWQTKPGPDAVRDGIAALDAIEHLRDLQDESTSSAELFSAWTLDYYWLAGRLLERSAPGDLDLAFSIAERLRARTLLERLGPAARSGAQPQEAASAAGAASGSIALVQRRLLDPALAPADRARLLADLERLERQDREARRQASVAAGRRPGDGAGFAGLEAVQATLADDEAVLSFQVGLRETYDGQFGGGSWLVAFTRRQQSVFRVPDRSELAAAIPIYTGLILRDDPLAAAAGLRLHDRLLGDAMRWLPPQVRRLIVIPDGLLHQLPFDALRATPESAPLAARYEIVVAPSATLWRRWRLEPSPLEASRVLAVADPEVAASAGAAPLRNATLQQGLRLGRLPFARQEVRAIRRHLDRVDVLEGAAASELALKRRDLSAYGILHVAAHAVADDARPERSAVLLAPGAAGEDGLLQAREIEALDLDGRVVVLSACQSAGGVVQSGEGVLSLARAFFAAGARTVIGSRWPIRDEDAAWFFDRFYDHLSAGASLSAALRHTKADAIASGRPATAWAGVVLLGSGDGVPVAAPRKWAADRTIIVAVGAGALVGLAVVAWVARSTIRRPRATEAARRGDDR